MKKSIKKLLLATLLAVCTVVGPVAFAEETATTTMAADGNLLAVFEEADMAMRSLGGALDRYNGGSDLNCDEFQMYADVLANVQMADVSGVWVDLHAIYVKAVNHATDAINGVVSTCANNGMGILPNGGLSDLNYGVARMGINEALEVIRPALIVGAEQAMVPEVPAEEPMEEMPEAPAEEPMEEMPEAPAEEPMEEMPEAPAEEAECVIPASGPWPACATAATVEPVVPDDCVVPETGPWPECAKTAPQKAVPAQVIVEEEVVEEEAAEEEEVVLEDVDVIETPTTDYTATAAGWTFTVPGGYDYEDLGGGILVIKLAESESAVVTIVPESLSNEDADVIEELISLDLIDGIYQGILEQGLESILEIYEDEFSLDSVGESIFSDMTIGTGEVGLQSDTAIVVDNLEIYLRFGVVYNRETESLVLISATYAPVDTAAKIDTIINSLQPE